MNEPAPPAEIRYLTDALGIEATLKLLEHYAGQRVYIPAEPNQASPLARNIGLDAARALGRLKGGETWKCPALKQWRAGVYRARGQSIGAIAKKLGVDESTVSRYLNPIVSHITQLTMDLDPA